VKANVIQSDWWDRFNSTTTANSEINIPHFGKFLNAVAANLLKGYRFANNLPLW
jgi:hypothetical protein